jgi:hypothetical protein
MKLINPFQSMVLDLDSKPIDQSWWRTKQFTCILESETRSKMPYSPLDTFDADDFSHLPTVDGPLPTAKTPIHSRQPLAEIEPVLPHASEWVPDETAFQPGRDDESSPPSDFSILTGISDYDPQESLLPESASSIPSPTPSLVQPFISDEPEAPADNAPQIYEAKKRAFALAAGIHLFLLLVLAAVQVVPLTRPSAEIVAISSVDSTQNPAWKRIAQPAPSASAGPSLQPIVALGNSQTPCQMSTLPRLQQN